MKKKRIIEPFNPELILDLSIRKDIESIKSFQIPAYYDTESGEFLDPIYTALYVSGEMIWDCALQWLYKKRWNKTNSHPYKNACGLYTGLYTNTETLGELLRSAFDVCVELHQFRSDSSACYSSGSRWFASVAVELRNVSFNSKKKMDAVHLLRQISKAFNPGEETGFPSSSNLTNIERLYLASKGIDRHEYPDYDLNFLSATGRKKGQSPGFRTALSAWASTLQNSKAFCIHKATPQKIQWKGTDGKSLIGIDKESISSRLWELAGE
jgi:hypothetical protein